MHGQSNDVMIDPAYITISSNAWPSLTGDTNSKDFVDDKDTTDLQDNKAQVSLLTLRS